MPRRTAGSAAGPPDDLVDCYSEFLPTKVYAGPMHFRLTARDGKGGVGSADTKVKLAPEHRSVPGDLAERWRVAGSGLDADGDLEGRRHALGADQRVDGRRPAVHATAG